MTTPPEQPAGEIKPIDAVALLKHPQKSGVLARTRAGAIVHLVTMDEVNAVLNAGIAISSCNDEQWASAVSQAKATGAVIAGS